MKRLDLFLTEKMGIKSRNQAQELITNQKVKVNGKTINKQGFLTNENDLVEISNEHIYVSRAAHKLIKAINVFEIDLENKNAIDIGSSTGGFSEVMLQYKINHIYCIDVGTNQLDKKISSNQKVTVYENTNFKDVELDAHIKMPINFITIDVSFISIQQILLKISQLFKSYDKTIEIVALLKPQFELGKKIKNCNYKVNENDRKRIIQDFEVFCQINKFSVLNKTISPILGAKRENVEYLYYLKWSANDK